MLVLVLSFSCIFIYGFWALLIYAFDERGYRFIRLMVPGYFLAFFLLEILSDYRPKVRALGLAILLLVVSALIFTRDSISVWEGLGMPMLFIIAVLGSYTLLTTYRVFKNIKGPDEVPSMDQQEDRTNKIA